MKAYRPQSAVEQLAAHLREEILRGSLSGLMPGVHHLVAELGTSPNTVLEAVRQLEREGLLENQGPGKRSKIIIPEGLRPPGLRIEILLFEKTDVAIGYMIELKHQLMEAGHFVTFSDKSLCGMGMNVERLARYVKGRQVEAWVVMCGTLPVLKWFESQPIPTLAMFGCMRDVQLASVIPEKRPALTTALQRLVALGHRRIVMLVREHNRKPKPTLSVQCFLDFLEAEGIPTGPYNLPEWQEDAAGLCQSLDSLFLHTPPTAIIIDEVFPFMVARMHLAQRGITTPKDVSLICLDSDPIYTWCEPAISHIHWNTKTFTRRIMGWADNVARGKHDDRKTFLKAEFIEGGTIGPAP